MIRNIDARGWIGVGVYSLVVLILVLMARYPELRADEFFKTIATLIIGTAFVNGVASWAYSATKQGGELADRAANLAEQRTAAPQPVTVVNPPSKPVPTTENASQAAPGEDLPEYAR